jgi:hypothetical protein
MSKIYQKKILEWKMPITSKGIHKAYGKNFAIWGDQYKLKCHKNIIHS